VWLLDVRTGGTGLPTAPAPAVSTWCRVFRRGVSVYPYPYTPLWVSRDTPQGITFGPRVTARGPNSLSPPLRIAHCPCPGRSTGPDRHVPSIPCRLPARHGVSRGWMTIRHPGASRDSGSSPAHTFAARVYSTTRASSRHTPAAVRASSVDRMSLDRSGGVCGRVGASGRSRCEFRPVR